LFPGARGGKCRAAPEVRNCASASASTSTPIRAF